MMSNTTQIIKQCRSLPGVTVTEGDGRVELRLSCEEGSGRMRFIPLFPGITLALTYYYTRSQVEMAKQIEAVVSGDLSRQHTAREFAALFSVSESSVKNYIRGVYGQSILQYATQRKMLHAAELLADTALPVIEIASRVGYENQSKFSAVFHKRFGVSPREYRRSHRLLGEK